MVVSLSMLIITMTYDNLQSDWLLPLTSSALLNAATPVASKTEDARQTATKKTPKGT